jgi:hypothetical protein
MAFWISGRAVRICTAASALYDSSPLGRLSSAVTAMASASVVSSQALALFALLGDLLNACALLTASRAISNEVIAA